MLNTSRCSHMSVGVLWLYSFMSVQHWSNLNPYGDGLTMSHVQVEWEFWTNSNDMCGAVCDVQREFIKVRFPFSHCCAWGYAGFPAKSL